MRHSLAITVAVAIGWGSAPPMVCGQTQTATPFSHQKTVKKRLEAPPGPLIVPRFFEKNQGQAPKSFDYIYRHPQFDVLINTRGFTLVPKDKPNVGIQQRLNFSFADANTQIRIAGVEQQTSVYHYYLGKRRLLNVPLYNKILYENLYPGINLVLYLNGTQLEYDFHLAQGADPKRIKMRVKGPYQWHLEGKQLVLFNDYHSFRQHIPAAYHLAGKNRIPVDAQFKLSPAGHIRFTVSHHNPLLPLVIDPVLDFSTALGGSSDDQALAVTSDASSGAIYIAGKTLSMDFPANSPPINSPSFIFISKIIPGNAVPLQYTTFIADNGTTQITDLALDGSDIFMAGYSRDNNLPVTGDAFQSIYQGINDGIIFKFDALGVINYGSFFGGGGDQLIHSLRVASPNHIYFAGETLAALDPLPSVNSYSERREGFIAALDISQVGTNQLSFLRYVGGLGDDSISHLTLDAAKNILVTGYSTTPGLNLGIGAAHQGKKDAFIASISTNGASQYFLMYLGGAEDDTGIGIDIALELDTQGNEVTYAIIAGNTESSGISFPAASPTNIYSGKVDVFFAKMKMSPVPLAGENPIQFFTYWGGADLDKAYRFSRDTLGKYWIIGESLSAPNNGKPLLVNSIQGTRLGFSDAFVLQFDASGLVHFSSYLGGIGTDKGLALVLGNKQTWLAGYTTSPDFPNIKASALPMGLNNNQDENAFIARLDTTLANNNEPIKNADLDLNVSYPAFISVNTDFDVVLTVINHGPMPVTAARLQVFLPVGLFFSTNNNSAPIQNGVWNTLQVGYLGINERKQWPITLQANAEQIFQAEFSVWSEFSDIVRDNNIDRQIVSIGTTLKADIDLQLGTPIARNNSIIFSHKVTNLGPNTARDIDLTIALHEQTQYQDIRVPINAGKLAQDQRCNQTRGVQETIVCHITVLEKNEVIVIEIYVMPVNQSKFVSVTSKVTSPIEDPQPDNNNRSGSYNIATKNKKGGGMVDGWILVILLLVTIHSAWKLIRRKGSFAWRPAD